MNLSSHKMEANNKVKKTPEVIDQLLCTEIGNISEQESDFWSSAKRDPREFAHSLFQYPAMMVPRVQKKVIETLIKVNPGISAMLDPYVGAGTTFAAGMSCGLNCFGQDINPLAILVSMAKTDFGWEDNDLKVSINQVVQNMRSDTMTDIEVFFPNMGKWFRLDVSIELSRIRRAIIKQDDVRIRRVLWTVFAETIRYTSNDRTSTFKLHVRPEEEIQRRILSPIQIFENLVQLSLKDLLNYKYSLSQAGYINNNKFTYKAELNLGNTTQTVPSPRSIGKEKFDLLVTSPPYGDNNTTVTYGQHSFLPLQWIDLADINLQTDRSLLRTTQEIDRRSLGGRNPKELEELIQKLKPESELLINIFNSFQLTNQPIDRTARVASFYQDYIKGLDRILASLDDNAYLVWTVGNRRVGGIEIPNDKILIELLSNRHTIMVADINRIIHNKRMPYKNDTTQMMGEERIMIFRKQAYGMVPNE